MTAWYFAVYRGKHGYIAWASQTPIEVGDDPHDRMDDGSDMYFVLDKTADLAMAKLQTQMRNEGLLGELH